MSKTKFNFKDIIIDYDIQDVLYIFYCSDDNKYNKEIDLIIKDMWYIRNRLVRSYPLNELWEWFEYKRLGIYISKKHIEEMESEKKRWDNIRKWILSNIEHKK